MVKLQGLLSDRSKVPVMIRWRMDPLTPMATHANGGDRSERPHWRRLTIEEQPVLATPNLSNPVLSHWDQNRGYSSYTALW